MKTAIHHILAALAIVATAACQAADEPAPLKQARAAYEKELDTVSRPVRERYARTLTDLKRALVSKGEIAAALLVEQEIARVGGNANPAFARLAGDWTITYASGAVRHYTISGDGSAAWTDSNPPKQGKLTQNAGYYLLDFSDGKLEKLTPSGSTIQIEHFDPATKHAKRIPGVAATAKRQ